MNTKTCKTRFNIIIFILIYLISNNLTSQIFYKNLFLVPAYDKYKDSYNLIFNKPTNYGTVIDEVMKTAKRTSEYRVDSVGSDSRVIKIKESNERDKYMVYLTLKNEDYEYPITVSVFNLLGKKVMDVYRGLPYAVDNAYEIPTNELPKGIYICNVVGKGFRLDSKFIVTR